MELLNWMKKGTALLLALALLLAVCALDFPLSKCGKAIGASAIAEENANDKENGKDTQDGGGNDGAPSPNEGPITPDTSDDADNPTAVVKPSEEPGTIHTVNGRKYMILNDGAVSLIGFSNRYKTKTTIVIPEFVTIRGKRYRITQIGPKAFSKCKKLKTLKFKSKKSIKVSERAFAGLKSTQLKKIKVCVNKKMSSKAFKALKKRLVKCGLKKKKITHKLRVR